MSQRISYLVDQAIPSALVESPSGTVTSVYSFKGVLRNRPGRLHLTSMQQHQGLVPCWISVPLLFPVPFVLSRAPLNLTLVLVAMVSSWKSQEKFISSSSATGLAGLTGDDGSFCPTEKLEKMLTLLSGMDISKEQPICTLQCLPPAVFFSPMSALCFPDSPLAALLSMFSP